MVFPLLGIVSLRLGMIAASCRKVFGERKNPNHGLRLRTADSELLIYLLLPSVPADKPPILPKSMKGTAPPET